MYRTLKDYPFGYPGGGKAGVGCFRQCPAYSYLAQLPAFSLLPFGQMPARRIFVFLFYRGGGMKDTSCILPVAAHPMGGMRD